MEKIELINTLLVEDNLLDAELLSEYLAESETTRFKITRVERLAEALARIQAENFDIILLDLSLPDSHGLDTFVRVHSAARGTPIIVQSGLDDETTAIRSVQAGAQDYLVKGSSEPRVLVQSIRYAVERGRVERMKSEFIAAVGHELKTPLTSIYSSLDLLRDSLPRDLPEKSRSLLEIAEKNCERLRLLVNDILDVERLETGSVRLRLEQVVVEPFLREALAEHSAYASKYGVEFELQGDVPDVSVPADRHRLMQVLANMLSNAAKFSPKGEAVHVSVERKDNQVRVSVRDRGPGIPEGFRARIFQKFAQAAADREGTGLGLNIARGIIQSLGGDIGFESEPGRGAEFWFSLREWDPERDAAASRRPPVLLLTHDPAFARMVENMLNKNARVTAIENVEEVLRHAEWERPAAVVLDGEVPGFADYPVRPRDHASVPHLILFGTADDERREHFHSVLPRDPAPNPEFHAAMTEILENYTPEAPPDDMGGIGEGEIKGGRILAAEDDPDIRRILEMVLSEGEGFELKLVENGRRALETLDDFAPDLVLLDVMMPDMDGPSALREIRSRPALENLPVVFLTARNQAEINSETRAYDTIAKPFKPAELRERVRSILSRINAEKAQGNESTS